MKNDANNRLQQQLQIRLCKFRPICQPNPPTSSTHQTPTKEHFPWPQKGKNSFQHGWKLKGFGGGHGQGGRRADGTYFDTKLPAAKPSSLGHPHFIKQRTEIILIPLQSIVERRWPTGHQEIEVVLGRTKVHLQQATRGDGCRAPEKARTCHRRAAPAQSWVSRGRVRVSSFPSF